MSVICMLIHTPLLAQEETLSRKISVSFSEKSLPEALAIVGKESGLSINYNSSLVNKETKLTKNYRDITVQNIIRDLVGDQLDDLRVSGNILTIRFIEGKGSVSGKLKFSDGEPLAFGEVSAGANYKTTADENGNYRLTGLPVGQYEISIKLFGELLGQQQLEVKKNASSILNFELNKSSLDLQEITVVGKTEAQELNETEFNVKAIDTRAYANMTADVNQILSRTGGVRIREEGGLGSGFNFAINGLSGSHIKFFIDGIPIESFGSGMTFNNIPVNLIERIEVYKGVVPAHLGADALGGAVNIITKRNDGKSLDVSYSFGSFGTHRAAINSSYTAPRSGITLNVSSFYNTSKNNYFMRNNPEANVNLQVIEDNKFVTKDKLRRFHDGYTSYMVQAEAGVANKNWADVLVVGLLYTDVFSERQTGATQTKVLGEVTNESHSVVPSVRYRKDKFLNDKLSLGAFANYSIDKSIVTDTSSRTWYQWNGLPDRTNQSGGEYGEDKYRFHFTGYNSLVQTNLNYKLADNHSLGLNYNFNSSYRESYDEIDPYENSYYKSNRINKTILGLSYQQALVDNRWTNSFFVKYFGMGGNVVNADDTESKEYKDYLGYGLASRFKIIGNFGVKASYEHAYRLPGIVELYGNKEDVVGNPNLLPEESDNYNFGIFYLTDFGGHSLSLEGGAFYRNARNYILNAPISGAVEGAQSWFFNAGGIKVDGFEVEADYKFKRLVSMTANLSYQNAVDREKYVRGSNRPKITYGSRVPNQPWLYGNFELNVGKDDVLGTDSRVQLNWFSQYINEYSLSWSKLGDKTTKDYIPNQLIHNLALTYSRERGRYNITVESRNITDVIAYDNFKLQKPGRSFSLKLRYFIHDLH
ncbi:outer membrane receptor protein involved in Fe transport [Algoriphagus sp. 4150]|uniref:TonB-dependent receptor n=1 Tax=Algoriphagus sp. 4150 TaxID=2817756 RepID=UPI00285F73AE|nr:TonB-dependent receptor [Algoriphagus sp. 4150]MDR7129554.1 outer membrane receptor protein involved in Fe transport [Algoriphagus sp. 4150]